MFKREQAPYLFTLAIAALGWLITRAVDETMKSPLVAYSTCESIENGERIFTARLHNISASTVFRNLYVILTNPSGAKSQFRWADLEYERPIHPNKMRKGTAQWEDTWAGCMISELQPRTSVRLKAKIAGPDTPVLRFDSEKDTVRLVKEGLLTGAIEYESEILLGLATVLIVLLAIYVICLTRSSS